MSEDLRQELTFELGVTMARDLDAAVRRAGQVEADLAQLRAAVQAVITECRGSLNGGLCWVRRELEAALAPPIEDLNLPAKEGE